MDAPAEEIVSNKDTSSARQRNKMEEYVVTWLKNLADLVLASAHSIWLPMAPLMYKANSRYVLMTSIFVDLSKQFRSNLAEITQLSSRHKTTRNQMNSCLEKYVTTKSSGQLKLRPKVE